MVIAGAHLVRGFRDDTYCPEPLAIKAPLERGASAGSFSHHQTKKNIDFGSPIQKPHQTFQSAAMSQENGESRPRVGGIRVSLACVPCRSRHVKCGAEMPCCIRCQQDEKPCFYTKSRRGMRDRIAPRKRGSLKEASRTISIADDHYSLTQDPMALVVPSYTEFYAGSSPEASTSSKSSSLTSSGKPPSLSILLDLYYKFLHKAHPYLLPRYYFLSLLESDPDSLKYLVLVMQYIGSLFARDISSTELQEIVFNQVDILDLPSNGFSVQTLLLTAIAMQSVDDLERARNTLDRAIYMALEIRMNSRNFANKERDPVLAESWRRTYWGLYVVDAMFASTRRAPNFRLYTVEANVELPCEEADYDGIIPHPRTFAEYETRDLEDEEPVFSSFTYLIALVRISGSVLRLDTLNGKDLESAVASADTMLVNWKLHLPREKQGVVDRNEDVDEVLFQAHSFLQSLFIFIHRPLSRLSNSSIENNIRCGTKAVSHEATGNEDRIYWLHTRKCLEAVETAINLYALPIPILQHTPIGICGIALATLVNISACASVLSGAEWCQTRDRIRLGLGGLKKFGEVWAVSRRIEKETKKIARHLLQVPKQGLETADCFDFDELMCGESLTVFEDLGLTDYLFDGESVPRNHMGNSILGGV